MKKKMRQHLGRVWKSMKKLKKFFLENNFREKTLKRVFMKKKILRKIFRLFFFKKVFQKKKISKKFQTSFY